MADGYDRFDNEGSGGSGFVMGLLTGTVLGAGLGILFAPKSGAEMRGKLSEQAGQIADTASEQYRRASDAAGDLVNKGREVYSRGKDKGREVYDRTKNAVSRGADEARRYTRETTESAGPPNFRASSESEIRMDEGDGSANRS